MVFESGWVLQRSSETVWVESNVLEAGTQIRQSNNIQMVSLHDDDTALARPASPVPCPWIIKHLFFASAVSSTSIRGFSAQYPVKRAEKKRSILASVIAPETHDSFLMRELKGRQTLHNLKPHMVYWRRQPWPWAAYRQADWSPVVRMTHFEPNIDQTLLNLKGSILTLSQFG